jgi:hypothetical protein
MVIYRCDGCGKKLRKHELRYKVKIDVRAAYDQLEIGLADLVRDHRAEMVKLIEDMRTSGKTEEDIEETVYKSIELDLCPSCQRRFIRAPLRFQPGPAAKEPEAPVDIDSFLRSLGFGESEEEDKNEG